MIRKIHFNKDTWITNLRLAKGYATGSNHGRDEILELFKHSEYIGAYSSTYSKILAQIDVSEITDMGIAAGTSVLYILKMFNAEHDEELPSSYDIQFFPMVSQSWDEGAGLDSGCKDDGYCNWFSASSTSDWNTSGAFHEYKNDTSGAYHIDTGWEDVDCDVSDVVSYWLSGNTNYGMIAKLSDTAENNSVEYYRKSFYSRHSQDISKRPYIEIAYDDSKFDDRYNMYYNESGYLYMYRYVNGELKDFNTNLVDHVYVKVQDVVSGTALYNVHLTSSYITTGTYRISLNISSTGSYSGSSWHDIWYSGSTVLYSGVFQLHNPQTSSGTIINNIRASVANLRPTYSVDDVAKIRVVLQDTSRHKNKIASASYMADQIYSQKLYWAIKEDFTNETIIPFNTGSVKGTRFGYDAQGHNALIYMDNFIPRYSYKMILYVEHNGEKKILDEGWRFKIV